MCIRDREIAAECGVSEQAVRGWCRRNHVAKDAKGSFALSERQKSSIYLHYLGVERNEVSNQRKQVAKLAKPPKRC